MRWKLVGAGLFVLVGVAAIVVVLVRPGAASTGNNQYLTAQVTRATVTNDIAANGTLAPVTRYGLAFGQSAAILGAGSSSSSASSSSNSSSGSGGSSTTWPVKTVTVSPGDTVKKGDTLATADVSSIDSQITQATYNLASAQAQLDQAASNLSAATTNTAIWQARTQYYNAKTAVANATQTRANLESEKALATITAPADGIVEAVNAVAGSDAPGGDAIVLDSGGLQAVISVTETDLPNVKLGQTATVAINAVDSTARGTVTAISPTASGGGNSSVVTYPVTVGISSAPAAARSGMSVSVSITIAQATDAIAVPSIALLGQTGGYSVRVMDASGNVTDVPVQVGLITSTLTQVTSGVSVGDRVVVGVSNASTGSTTTGGLGGLGGGLGGGFRGVTGGGAFGR
jgi:macrolide-specific efflux system membrane fusion protein